MKYIVDAVLIQSNDVIAIIDEVAKYYPTKIFHEPELDETAPSICYTAAGARLACKLIRQKIDELTMEILSEKCLESIIDRMNK